MIRSLLACHDVPIVQSASGFFDHATRERLGKTGLFSRNFRLFSHLGLFGHVFSGFFQKFVDSILSSMGFRSGSWSSCKIGFGWEMHLTIDLTEVVTAHQGEISRLVEKKAPKKVKILKWISKII